MLKLGKLSYRKGCAPAVIEPPLPPEVRYLDGAYYILDRSSGELEKLEGVPVRFTDFLNQGFESKSEFPQCKD